MNFFTMNLAILFFRGVKAGQWTGQAALLVGGLIYASSASAQLAAPCMVLGIPVLTNGQLRFTLSGAPNVVSVIQTSYDLRTWTPVLTNVMGNTQHVVTISVQGEMGFYRVKVASQAFRYAIVANGPVKLGGNTIVDSYDSSLGNYDPVTNRNAKGDVATNSRQLNAIDVGSAHIYGRAITGPGGTVTVTNGSVGDLTWTNGIQPGWVSDDMNVQFQPNSPPTGPFDFPRFETVGVTNITYLDSGKYRLESFVSIAYTRPMIVTGNATLYVLDDFAVQGTGYVYIQPGASLKLYIGGIAAISGSGVVNGTGLPANFSLYGLPSNSTVFYSGAANLIGTIKAPQAAFKISGAASIFGAIICDTFTSSGLTSVHYDESLTCQVP